MSSCPSATMLLLSLFLVSLFTFISLASVPPNATFRYVTEGQFGPYVVEYDGNYRALPTFNSPFQLCFYNTTPDALTLAVEATQFTKMLPDKTRKDLIKHKRLVVSMFLVNWMDGLDSLLREDK